jgi:hypothetical protein
MAFIFGMTEKSFYIRPLNQIPAVMKKSLPAFSAFAVCFSFFVGSASACDAVPPSGVDIESEAYATVIANDLFCCNTAWDGICQNAYNNFSNTGGGSVGGGNEPGGCITPPSGVDVNSAAYASVIANDPFCCNTSWDGICQNAYNQFSSECAPVPDGVDINSSAYAQVISQDPFCCNASWDSICQNTYDYLSNSGPSGCITPPALIDVDSDAYAWVISTDQFCCYVAWDGICQNAYNNYGNTGGGSGGGGNEPGGCIAPPSGVDVNSAAYASVIANDPFCCNTAWDGICQNAYDNYGNTGGGSGGGGNEPGGCIAPPSGVDVNSAAYASVIANDPFCCNTVWDGICQNAYNDLIGGCSVVPPAGVDVESDAYATVIANDPFCCNTAWDGICQYTYNQLILGGMAPKPIVVPSAHSDELFVVDFSMFPNPTTDFVNLIFNNSEKAKPEVITLYNAIGQVVMSIEMPSDAEVYNTTLNVSQLKGGIYFVTIQSLTGTISTKQLVKQ